MDDRSALKIIHIYLFETGKEHLSPIDPDHPKAEWVDKDEVVQFLTHPKDREFFEKIKDEL